MTKLYVITRRDLSKSQQAVQAGHAVAEYLLTYSNGSEGAIRSTTLSWNNGTLVYLTVNSEKELWWWWDQISGNKVKFHESDRANELTSIATVQSQNMFGSLRLL